MTGPPYVLRARIKEPTKIFRDRRFDANSSCSFPLVRSAAPHLPITYWDCHWFHYPIPHQLQYIVLSCPIAAQFIIPKIRKWSPLQQSISGNYGHHPSAAMTYIGLRATGLLCVSGDRWSASGINNGKMGARFEEKEPRVHTWISWTIYLGHGVGGFLYQG